MALTANQLVVGMMNMAVGGYNTLVTDYMAANGDIASANALLGVAGLSTPALGGDLVSNSSFATTLVGRVLSGATSTVKADVATLVVNYMTQTGKSRGEVAVELITMTINASASHPLLGAASTAFAVKVAAADAYTGTSTDATVLGAVVGASTGSNEASATTVLTTIQDILTGTTGSDTFRGVAGAAIGSQDQTTLNSSDIIDGAGGLDTFIVNMTGAAYNGGARIKNIETLQIGTNQAAATFDYNVNEGQNEISEVTKIVADQINVGETLTVSNIIKTAGALPTLAWYNDSINTAAGTFTSTYRAAQVSGTTDTQTVELSNVNNGILNMGAGVETITVTSKEGSARNTLANSANVDAGAVNGVAVYANTADIVSSGALTKVVLQGASELGKAADIITATGLTDRAALGAGDLGSGATTQSNLLSVEARVTEVDASAMTAASNVRFSVRTDNVGVNVTHKGGSGNDYVEFQLGNVSATGGDGNDTFAFVNGSANSTFGSTDSITGGAGTDAIQLGLNGAGTFTLNTTEFANKTGVDVLDMRGVTNTVSVSDGFAAASDSGILQIRTDRAVQTSASDSANATGTGALEDAMVSVINITDLAANRGIDIIGGSGSDRVVANNASLNANSKVDGGTRGNATGLVAGDYDSITILDTAVIDRGDLANIKNVEGFVLAKTAATAQFNFELTEAFLLANTAATNDAVNTDIADTSFTIGTAAAANGSVLTAADTVTIDISDLLNAGRTALKTTLAGRGIDVTTVGATVNYIVDGAAATGAQIALVTLSSTVPASVTGSAAQVAAGATGITWASSAVAAQANVLGTNNNDTFTLTMADTVNGGTGSDTVNLNAGSALAVVTLGTGADTININTAIAATGAAVVTTGVASTVNITVDQGAAADLTQEIVGAFAHTYNVSAIQAGLTVLNTAAATINASAGGTFTLGAAGQIFNGSGAVAYVVNGAAAADTVTITGTGATTIVGAGGIDTITLNSANAAIDIVAFNDVAGGAGIVAAVDRDVVTGFQFGAGVDVIRLDTVATTGGAAAAAAATLTASNAVGAVNFRSATENADVLVLNFDMGGAADVLSADLTGAALVANMGGAITTTAADTGYIFAIDNGVGYLYYFNAAAGVATVVEGGEIALIGRFTGASVNGTAAGDFVMAV